MVQTGDYFTPRYYEGFPYLKKPILTFWTMAASYKIFGINLFSSRIPFLIAGCIIIWLTYKFALLLFRREKDALLAATIIASNFTLFHISVRSTPDALFSLFVSLSLYGFASLIFNRDQKMINYIFAYVGAGLAVATHGFWGAALPVAFAFIFWFVRKRDTVPLRDLIDIKSIIIAVFIASFWYVISYYHYGDAFIQQFFEDQIVGRWSGLKGHILNNMLTYLLALVGQFLPWSVIFLLVAMYDKNAVINFFRKHKDVCLFIIGWYLAYYVIYSFGNIQRARYFFPTYPLISALYAALLIAIADRGHASSPFRTIERGIILACLSGGCLLALAGLFIDMRLVIGGLILICVTAALLVLLPRRNALFGLVTVALCLVMFYSVTENFISSMIYNPPAPRVVNRVREYTQGPIEIAAIGMPPSHYQTQIYVLSGGSITVNELEDGITPEMMKQFQFIMISESLKDKINLDGYAIEECGYSYEGRFNVRSLWSIRKIADFRDLLSHFKQHYYLLIKSESSHH
jgi:4-amino-4-deoxy-L-arabinose transferase-like glycosyltransferase